MYTDCTVSSVRICKSWRPEESTGVEKPQQDVDEHIFNKYSHIIGKSLKQQL